MDRYLHSLAYFINPYRNPVEFELFNTPLTEKESEVQMLKCLLISRGAGIMSPGYFLPAPVYYHWII